MKDDVKKTIRIIKLFYSVKTLLIMITTGVILASDEPLSMLSKIFVFAMAFDLTITASRNMEALENIKQEIEND